MMNRRIASLIRVQQAERRRVAWMEWARQLRRGLEEGTGLTLRPLKDIPGTRAWSEAAGKGKERENAQD